MITLQMLWMQAQTILNREEGQDLIEYALLVGLISLAAVASIQPIGRYLEAIYLEIQAQLLTAY